MLGGFLERLRTGLPADISRFAEGLPAEFVELAISLSGKATIRKRKLPADKVVWLVIGMALFADRSIKHVVEHLGLVMEGLVPSAIAKARSRLGAEPLRLLFAAIADAWGRQGERLWRGLSLHGIDGSHLRVDDSDENAAHFGRPAGRAHAGYPQLRMVALLNLTSRMVTGAEVGPWASGEVSLAKQLWSRVPDNSLTIVDRGFLSMGIFLHLLARGTNRHFLVRLKSNSKYRVTQTLPDGSALATVAMPKELIRQAPELPREVLVRIVAYHHPGGQPGVLMTSLMDYQAYPADELVRVYHERWELEVAFDEIKTHLLRRKEALRSRTVEGVYQEFWGILLLYNLIRREMGAVAATQGISPSRVSFISAMLQVQNFFLSSMAASPGTLPRELADMETSMARNMILPPRRSERRVPRQVKIKMSNYPKAPARRTAAA